MDKPLILEINDFLNDLAEVINKYSGKIPCSVILDKLDDITEVVKERSRLEYLQAKKEYEESEVNVDG